MTRNSVCPAILFSALVAAPAVQAAEPVLQVASSANGLSASFTVGSITTGLPPVAVASGTGPAPYINTTNIAAFTKTLGIADGTEEIATLGVTAASIHSRAKYAVLGIDIPNLEGNGRIGSAELTLQPFPPPAGPAALPLLNIMATTVTDSSSATQAQAGHTAVTGTAAIAHLTITGSLIGGKALTFAGAAAPNTVLYNTPTISIVLNAESKVGVISCTVPTPGCTFLANAITTRAIAVTLTQANIGGHLVSGDIVVGESSASIP